ncbi:MAG: hypothetical protein BGO63_11310 [Candidatus Accumulibacter sp. 66-26]|nr:hypothetical protein [Accumulibacter sp.]OJW50293.1 MAG: hypothetical protein BGO63_11310 [Candidatus Accumulibacter sp. 66-26]
MNQMLEAMFQVRKATLAAWERTADKSISTRVENGKYQIVRVKYYATGKSMVTPLSDWLTSDEVVGELNKL